jgi:hypothetical protein
VEKILRKILVCPNSGRVPPKKAPTQRGAGRSHVAPHTLDPVTDLATQRRLMLYWDQIVYLNHNERLVLTSDDEYLKDAGVFDELRFTFECSGMERFNPMAFAAIYETALRQAFQHVSASKSTIWSYLEPSWANASTPDHSIQRIELTLQGLLPVPTESVSFEDILDFKQRRVDELSSLRIALDDLATAVHHSPDPLRGLDKAALSIASSLDDLRRAARGTLKTRLLGTFKVGINVPNLTTGAVAGAAAASLLHLPLELGAAAGAVAAAISAELQSGSVVSGLPRDVLAFKYAQDAEESLGR